MKLTALIGQSGSNFYIHKRAFIRGSLGINPLGDPRTDTLRVAANGDIYQKIGATEALVIPALPATNQTWTVGNYPYFTQFRILDNNATVTTPDCKYTSCLKLSIVAGDSAVSYYHRGVGLIKQEQIMEVMPPNYFIQLELFLNKIILN